MRLRCVANQRQLGDPECLLLARNFTLAYSSAISSIAL